MVRWLCWRWCQWLQLQVQRGSRLWRLLHLDLDPAMTVFQAVKALLCCALRCGGAVIFVYYTSHICVWEIVRSVSFK